MCWCDFYEQDEKNNVWIGLKCNAVKMSMIVKRNRKEDLMEIGKLLEILFTKHACDKDALYVHREK